MATKDRTTRSTARNRSTKARRSDTGDSSRPDTLIKGTDDIRSQLAEHLGALRFVNGTISVCVQALQQQDADMDCEIALVLQRTAGDKLDATIDHLEALALGMDYEEA